MVQKGGGPVGSSTSSSMPLQLSQLQSSPSLSRSSSLPLPPDALHFMCEMEALSLSDRSLRPRAHVFLALMRALAAAGDWQRTAALAERMAADASGRVWPEDRAEAAQLVMEAAVRAGQVGEGVGGQRRGGTW